jgi:hypothetical protein
MMQPVAVLEDESQWPKIVADRPAQGSEKWLTFLRLWLFEILGAKDESLYEHLEKLFSFAHFVVETESIGESLCCLNLDANIPLLVIEDSLDVLPISWIGRIFDYLENNLIKITNGLVPGRGKALPLLRLCNESLRRLSKSENASMCGRIQVFLANVFPLSERSGVNLKGLFHTENVTTFDEDVEMQDEKNKFDEMYRDFWSLQTWFSQPVLLFDSKEFAKFKEVRVYV